jgi:hypothetical protein
MEYVSRHQGEEPQNVAALAALLKGPWFGRKGEECELYATLISFRPELFYVELTTVFA